MEHFNSSSIAMRREERAAASRQKSCNACVRGKRRCDKRTPRCTRCAAKGLDCVYQRMPPGASGPSTGGSPEVPSISEVPEFDMNFDMESLETETSPESLQADGCGGLHMGGAGTGPGMDVGFDTGMDSALDFSIVDLLTGSSSVSGNSFWDMERYEEPSKMDIPPVPSAPPAAPRPIRDLAMIKAVDQTCEGIDPLEVYNPKSRVGFIVNFLTNMHTTFAQTRAAPFMHPRLWATHLPKTVMSAFSAATAYTGRTEQNKAWTMRLLADAARDIYRDGEKAEGAEEKLARVQALVLVNSMRVFDGDLAMRAAAEREMGVFVLWLKELVDVMAELEAEVAPAVSSMRDRQPKTWETWILLESVRRSVMTTGAFICLFYLLKSEEPDAEVWACRQSFTASRHLWEAASSIEFYRSWREKAQYRIEDMVFKELWMYGQADDVDEFTKVLMTSQLGVDAMEHFMTGDVAGASASAVAV